MVLLPVHSTQLWCVIRDAPLHLQQLASGSSMHWCAGVSPALPYARTGGHSIVCPPNEHPLPAQQGRVAQIGLGFGHIGPHAVVLPSPCRCLVFLLPG